MTIRYAHRTILWAIHKVCQTNFNLVTHIAMIIAINLLLYAEAPT